MRIAVGADHAGYRLKEYLAARLREEGHEVVDMGTHSEERTDYPLYAFRVAEAVAAGEAERGVLVCGTGIGMCIAANKVRGVRAALCWSVETAELSRRHNDANVICLGGRLLEPGEAWRILDVWLRTPFDGGRHARRLALIEEYERRACGPAAGEGG